MSALAPQTGSQQVQAQNVLLETSAAFPPPSTSTMDTIACNTRSTQGFTGLSFWDPLRFQELSCQFQVTSQNSQNDCHSLQMARQGRQDFCLQEVIKFILSKSLQRVLIRLITIYPAAFFIKGNNNLNSLEFEVPSPYLIDKIKTKTCRWCSYTQTKLPSILTLYIKALLYHQYTHLQIILSSERIQ